MCVCNSGNNKNISSESGNSGVSAVAFVVIRTTMGVGHGVYACMWQ